MTLLNYAFLSRNVSTLYANLKKKIALFFIAILQPWKLFINDLDQEKLAFSI